ncbi:MAG: hypothetical protein Q8O89_03670 [Nanoarchaeota archaeon]|nr:hypothetical protein [Nanoarchaeota archaeon]
MDIDDKHDSHAREIALTKKDIDDIRSWVGHVHKHNNELKQHSFEVYKYLVKVDNQQKELSEKIKQLEEEMKKGQAGTTQGTFKGQTRDMTNDTRMTEKNDNNELIFEKPKLVQRAKQFIGLDKDSLTGAEIEVVNLMYHSDRPLGYEEMANRLGKKEKSIRNLIYELRRKNVEILDKPIGVKEKGFYISKEAKIKLTGR